VRTSISVIISSYNQNKSLTEILSRLANSSSQINEVIVADDGSTPLLKDIPDFVINKQIQKFTFLHHEDTGFRKCKILNEAIKTSSSNYIVFLDGDCLPHKHFVRDHLALAEKGNFVQGRRCFIRQDKVACLLEERTSLKRLMLSGKVSGLLKSIRLPIPYIKHNKTMYGLLGCNLGVWRDDLIEINGFDEDYEGWGREDSDLCARLYNRGITRKMVYGRALVYHLNHLENDRGKLKKNDELLKEALRSEKTRCVNGITKG
jgi:GT2 family glycosyltransferase